MKLAIRLFALSVVVAGGVAAAIPSKHNSVIVSHQSATSFFPGPSMPSPDGQ